AGARRAVAQPVPLRHAPRDHRCGAASGRAAGRCPRRTMTRRADEPRSRRDFREAQGVLLVTREPPPAAPPAKGQPPAVPANPAEGPEIVLAVWDDGSVNALHGHVDLGTGIRTALAQIAADELDLGMDCIAMVLGDTARAPNQGATIASASIQIHGVPLRLAAAQARAWLLERAAE